MIPWLGAEPGFPPDERALREPNGLLAAGGALTPAWLLAAYRRGIFPWFSEGEPILWWTPDPRLVLVPDELHVSHSLRKTLRRRRFEVKADTAFAAVLRACAAPRAGGPGTWITPAMRTATPSPQTKSPSQAPGAPVRRSLSCSCTFSLLS